MIPFNKPACTGKELDYIAEAMRRGKISGDGYFTQQCHAWFQNHLACQKALLTTSCTHALEIAAILIDLKPGDEVIMPSYTFVSTANAFVLRGAKIVFIDIRPDTMNMDESKIEAAITDKTKAIVPVHYAGVSCDMDAIMAIAEKHHLYVIEDAAQGMMSRYKGKPLGTLGHLGAFSFHETKNYTSGGEGGLLIINDNRFIERAEIIREKGTNRSKFHRGLVDKYTWVDIGSSYLPSDINAAYLFAQLEQADVINHNRLAAWSAYYEGLSPLEAAGLIELPTVPSDCEHNAHMFYIKIRDDQKREQLIQYLKAQEISVVFHYVPLHSSHAGQQLARFSGEDTYTTRESDSLIRLPLFYNIDQQDVETVIATIKRFFEQ